GGFMPGCAAGVPGFVASGPTGVPTGDFSWDTDGSYGDWYGAHQLANTWGRPNAELSAGQALPSYPYLDNRISPVLEGDPAIYGFDITTRALYDPTWRDVMSLRSYLWVSDVTYESLLAFFQAQGGGAAAVDASAPQRLLVVGTINPATATVEL